MDDEAGGFLVVDDAPAVGDAADAATAAGDFAFVVEVFGAVVGETLAFEFDDARLVGAHIGAEADEGAGFGAVAFPAGHEPVEVPAAPRFVVSE